MTVEIAVLAAVLALPALILLRPVLKYLFRLGMRSAVSLGVLGALGAAGQYLGIHLGVNWVNALVLGTLGAPGLGLLLLLNWTLA